MILDITNKKVENFFQRNTNVDPNILLANVIDFYEYVSNNLSNGNNQQLLSYVIDSSNKIDNLKEQISNDITLKLFDIKNSYINELKNALVLENSNDFNTFTTIISKNNDRILSETKNIFADHNNKELLDNFSDKILNDTKFLLDMYKKNDSLQDTLNAFNNNIHSLQQPFLKNDEKVSLIFDQVKTLTESSNDNFKSICSQFQTFIDKFQNSSIKGQLSENFLFNVLTNLFPTAEIIDTSKTPNSCDFKLIRSQKIPILIENKNYKCNVGTTEVDKFLRDINTHDCSGIFLSQNSGVANKSNFLIEIYNSNVVVYVHNVNFDQSKIQIAIDIIDHLSNSLDLSKNSNESISISPDLLKNINFEFNSFIEQRKNIIDLSKKFQKDLNLKLSKLNLPSLESFLASRSIDNLVYQCDLCDFTSNKKNGLNAHKSVHKNVSE